MAGLIDDLKAALAETSPYAFVKDRFVKEALDSEVVKAALMLHVSDNLRASEDHIVEKNSREPGSLHLLHDRLIIAMDSQAALCSVPLQVAILRDIAVVDQALAKESLPRTPADGASREALTQGEMIDTSIAQMYLCEDAPNLTLLGARTAIARIQKLDSSYKYLPQLQQLQAELESCVWADQDWDVCHRGSFFKDFFWPGTKLLVNGLAASVQKLGQLMHT